MTDANERLSILLNELINEHRSGTGTSSSPQFGQELLSILIDWRNVSYKKDQQL